MKRVFAVTLLAAFAAGPSVKWLCERVCAEHPVAAAEDCHHSSESAQQMVGGHDCGDHDAAIALITKRVQPDSESFVSPRSPSASILWSSAVPSRFGDFTRADSSPPLAGFVAPLRI
jgi:hypothetical protein